MMASEDSSRSVITTQPVNSRIVLQDGGVTVRSLQDTPEDTAFAGRMTVDGFIDKFHHATDKNSTEKCYRLMDKAHTNQIPDFYDKMFVAEYEGKRAGILALKFSGDPEPRMPDDADCTEFGCCDKRGLSCLKEGMTEKEVPAGHCFLDHICVDEGFRGRGIGKVLMMAAEKEANRHNCSDIYLYVSSTNRAIHLYERQGYVNVYETGCCLCPFIWCMTGLKNMVKMSKRL